MEGDRAPRTQPTLRRRPALLLQTHHDVQHYEKHVASPVDATLEAELLAAPPAFENADLGAWRGERSRVAGHTRARLTLHVLPRHP